MNDLYLRNIPSISRGEQAVLRSSRVCVAGCGGLGGYCSELLARVGVGCLTLVDGDVFTASNINRQLYSSASTLGLNKAVCAARRVSLIDPDTRAASVPDFITPDNAAGIIGGHDLVIDALDNPGSRLVLSSAASALGLTLVHGAVDGWSCQVAVAEPGSGLLERVYQGFRHTLPVSTLSFTVSLCASLQTAEAVKRLLGRESPVCNKLFSYDLLSGDSFLVSV